jgi:uncharacterized coiled-coil protein SlyX
MPQVRYASGVTENRLTEVEIRYTYLEQLVKNLNQVIHEQQQGMAALSARVERLEGIISEAMQQPGDSLPHDKPPHY